MAMYLTKGTFKDVILGRRFLNGALQNQIKVAGKRSSIVHKIQFARENTMAHVPLYSTSEVAHVPVYSTSQVAHLLTGTVPTMTPPPISKPRERRRSSKNSNIFKVSKKINKQKLQNNVRVRQSKANF